LLKTKFSTLTFAGAVVDVGNASLKGSSEEKGSDVKPSDLNGSPVNSKYNSYLIETISILVKCLLLVSLFIGLFNEAPKVRSKCFSHIHVQKPVIFQKPNDTTSASLGILRYSRWWSNAANPIPKHVLILNV